MTTQIEIIAALREQILKTSNNGRLDSPSILSTGWVGLNQLLPGSGINRGSLVEWINTGAGTGAGTLALLTARHACVDGGLLVVIDRQGRFFPPAALALGMDPNQLLIVKPTCEKDELWALDQSLRCEGVSAVWCFAERLSGRSFRRLQLSAESGRCVGLLVRPEQALNLSGRHNRRLKDGHSAVSMPNQQQNGSKRIARN